MVKAFTLGSPHVSSANPPQGPVVWYGWQVPALLHPVPLPIAHTLYAGMDAGKAHWVEQFPFAGPTSCCWQFCTRFVNAPEQPAVASKQVISCRVHVHAATAFAPAAAKQACAVF